MEQRRDDELVAATRIITGTDVDYGALTHHLVDHLNASPGFAVHYQHRVTGLSRENNERWHIDVHDLTSGEQRSVRSKFVFIGAGGALGLGRIITYFPLSENS